ncbi:MAG: pentapeptide repeat-containing protein [Coxiellaceae bacterium]|nr:MAG: pentapeptide repeat-containing protein [Coxiellaceae bacterium]
MSGAEFIDACLIAADLSQVKQANAANFTGAMMGGVNAAHANLDNSNLAFTNLDHADLTNAHLQNVNDFGASMTAVKYRDSVPDAEAQDAIIASRVAATKRKKRERQINWLKDALNLGFPSDPSQLLNQLPNDKMANELRDLFEELRYQFTALGQALSFIEKQKITVSDYVNLYRAAVNMLSIEIRSEPDTVVRKINYQQLTENQVEAVQILHTIHLIQIFWESLQFLVTYCS